MLNPWIILALVVAWIASLAGVGYWQNQTGHTVEKAAWEVKETDEVTSANAMLTSLNNQVRAEEKRRADALDVLAQSYEEDLENAEKQRVSDVAAARAGTIVLRDPNSAGACAGASAPGSITSAPGRRDGGSGAGLSGEATEFLLTEADRANAVVKQLAACQAVVKEDRAP